MHTQINMKAPLNPFLVSYDLINLGVLGWQKGVYG